MIKVQRINNRNMIICRLISTHNKSNTHLGTSVETHTHSLGISLKQQIKKGLIRNEDLHKEKGSLIADTLKEMETNEEFQTTLKNLEQFGQKALTREEKKRRDRALDGYPTFQGCLKKHNIPTLTRMKTKVFQMNVGKFCNQACAHCHVESSPKRLNEQMSMDTAKKCLEVIKNSPSVSIVDITGGAPELNSEVFRFLVKECRALGLNVIDRCNLTVLFEPGQEDLAQFLADHKVHVIASLPCYGEKNVDKQRGLGVFGRSIRALQQLNLLGYGKGGENNPKLDLVYNPLGAFLPPDQAKLEIQYKKKLDEDFGIKFDQLFTITNMPIKRFADFLHRRGELSMYMKLLVDKFNPETVKNVMCRDYISIGWNGALYDCDFNQQMDLEVQGKKLSIFDIKSTDELTDGIISTGSHCFGCTAGAGSSCQGEVL